MLIALINFTMCSSAFFNLKHFINLHEIYLNLKP